MTLRIAVLGAGSWGSALSLLLARNQHHVVLWGHDAEHLNEIKRDSANNRYLPGIPFPDNVVTETDLENTLSKADIVLMAVPSAAFRSVLEKVNQHAFPKKIICATKGIDPKTHELLHDVAKECLGKIDFAVVSGPTFAKEVAEGKPSAAVISSENTAFAEFCQPLFHAESFRIYLQPDVIGVEICGVVKNVLAIASGISDGMALGANARAALLTRGLAEMRRLILALGGSEKTLLSLAGVGDLMLTAMGDLSRNRRFGLAIGKGKTPAQAIQEIGQVVEGVDNVKQVAALAREVDADMPITQQIYRILYKNVDPHESMQQLLTRDPQQE